MDTVRRGSRAGLAARLPVDRLVKTVAATERRASGRNSGRHLTKVENRKRYTLDVQCQKKPQTACTEHHGAKCQSQSSEVISQRLAKLVHTV